MAEDELADPGALGDAADLGDVGVQRGHPHQFGPGRAVSFQVAEVGHLVNEDVGLLGQGDQIVVHRGVAGEHDRAVRGVETVTQSRNRMAVRHRDGGDPDRSVVEDHDRNLGDALCPGRDVNVDAPKYTGAPYPRGQERVVVVIEPERQTVGVA